MLLKILAVGLDCGQSYHKGSPIATILPIVSSSSVGWQVVCGLFLPLLEVHLAQELIPLV